MKSKIGVIVPVLNRKNLVERCLDSIYNQTERPYELIVVDNGSTDGTFETVKKWMDSNCDSGIKFKLLLEPERGAAKARQKGLENTESEYLNFFDSDDSMKPDLIENVLNVLEGSAPPDIVCWKCRIHQLDGTMRVPPFMSDKPLQAHLIHTLLRPQGYLVEKSFLNKCGGWRKPFKVWNDFELGLRILLNHPKIKSIPKVLADIYSQKESITGEDFSSKEGQWEEIIREMEDVTEHSNHPDKEKIRKILNYRKAILAAHYKKEKNKEAAERLLQETLKDILLKDRFLLKFSYLYTSMGLRGVWRLIEKAYL